MQIIERLTTGTAVIYSPNAVLGRDKGGDLIMGTGKMIKVRMRKRITSDGGRAVLAVQDNGTMNSLPCLSAMFSSWNMYPKCSERRIKLV
jgi:hypothetical protein